MRNLIVIAALMTLIGSAALAVQTGTENSPGATQQKQTLYACPMHPEVILARPGKCPKCGMALVAKSKGLLMQEAHRAAGVANPGQPAARSAEGMGGSVAAMQGQMLRRRTMLTVRIDNADPAAMLALGDALKLTKEQSAKLATIAADARKKALALLNAEQRKALSAVPNEPASLTDVHRAAPSMGEQKAK